MSPRGVSLIAVAMLAAGGCGSAGNSSSTTRSTTGGVHRISLRNTPSFNAAKTACGAVPREMLARNLGLSTADPVAIARKYAERNSPLAARNDVYEGCYAALTK